MKRPSSYNLFVHWKQGDEFHDLLHETGSDLSAAFSLWADVFTERAALCEKLANELQGLKIDVQADTHMIDLEPGDVTARAALDSLVAEEILEPQVCDEECVNCGGPIDDDVDETDDESTVS
jgi:hypothetical protein